MRNVSDKIVQKIKTFILCLTTFFPRKSWRFLDNENNYGTVIQTTDDNTIRRMRFVCWITKATDTHPEYVTLTVFHGNSGYVKAPQYYVYVHCLTCLLSSGYLGLCPRGPKPPCREADHSPPTSVKVKIEWI